MKNGIVLKKIVCIFMMLVLFSTASIPIQGGEKASFYPVSDVTPAGDFNISIIKKVRLPSGIWMENVTIHVGEKVEFKIVVKNTGTDPNPLMNVHVIDILPPNLIYNYDANLPPDYVSSHHIEWYDIGPLYPNENRTILFNATATAVGFSQNYVNVSCCNCGYPYDEDIANVTVVASPVASINLTKLVKDGSNWVKSVTVYMGDDVDFKIILKNDGDINLTDLHVTDILPSFLIYNNDANITPSYFNDHIIEWDISHLNINETITIIFSAHVVSVGEGDNIARVTACQPVSDSDSVHVISGGLVIEKEVWNPSLHAWMEEINASVGDTIRFRIKLFYYGNGTYVLYDIHVRDELPDCLEYADNSNPPETDICGNTIWWNLSISLSAGSSTAIEFDALVTETSLCGSCVNIANASGRECSGRIFYWEDPATVHAECPLMADAGGPYFGDVDEMIHIEGSAEGGTPPYTYRWDLDNDGFYDDHTDRFFYYSWDEPGTYVISLRVDDSAGKWDIDDTTVTISPPGNSPPNTPGKPSGPTSGNIDVSYTYTTSTVDPDDNLVRYGWDWDGDNVVDEWTPYYHSGSTVTIVHSWSTPGTYHIKVKAEDELGLQSGFSESLTVVISSNSPPVKPSISGPTNGRIGVSYTYTAITSDPDGDKIYYMFDWGDGTTSGWLGPYNSGQSVSASHIWSNQGSYVIKVKAIDDPNGDGDISDGIESVWSDPLPITMPYIHILFYSLIERFPILKLFFLFFNF